MNLRTSVLHFRAKWVCVGGSCEAIHVDAESAWRLSAQYSVWHVFDRRGALTRRNHLDDAKC